VSGHPVVTVLLDGQPPTKVTFELVGTDGGAAEQFAEDLRGKIRHALTTGAAGLALAGDGPGQPTMIDPHLVLEVIVEA
jgi:hypothetical protein